MHQGLRQPSSELFSECPPQKVSSCPPHRILCCNMFLQNFVCTVFKQGAEWKTSTSLGYVRGMLSLSLRQMERGWGEGSGTGTCWHIVLWKKCTFIVNKEWQGLNFFCLYPGNAEALKLGGHILPPPVSVAAIRMQPAANHILSNMPSVVSNSPFNLHCKSRLTPLRQWAHTSIKAV